VALWSAFIVRLALAFVFVPCITEALGASRYGIWGILFQIINYLALLDFGFEKAIITFVASFLGKNDRDGVSRVIAASSRLYVWFGLAAFLIALLCAWLLLPHLKLDSPDYLHEARLSLIIIGLFAGLRFWFAPVSAALGGFQRYDSLTVIGVGEDIFRTLTMLLLLKSGFGLVELSLTVLGFGIARQLISVWWLKHIFPEWRLGVARDTTLTRELFDYSRVTFGITIAWMVIFNTDSLLLGFFASTTAAGIYNPATQMAVYMRHLVNAVGTPLTAAVAHARASADIERAKAQYLRLFAYASYGGFAVMSLVTIFAVPLVMLWLPSGFVDTAKAMIVLSIGSAVFIPHILSNSMLFAVNQHRLLLYTVTGEALLKILLAMALIRPMGAVGVALANAIPQVLVYTAVYPFLVGRALQMSPVTLLSGQLRSALVATGCTIVPGYILTRLFIIDSWPSLVGCLAAVGICAAGGFWAVLSPVDRVGWRKIFARSG
jgi:O-antigen/teichoic acid export membrane protein